MAGNPDQIRYTPDADFNGSDSFAYTIADGRGGSDTATVTVGVTAQPDDPVAQDDTFETGFGAALGGNLLADNGAGPDADPDGDTLVVNTTPIIGPANGQVTLAADGSFTYTPNDGFVGSDSFTYEITDGFGTDTANVDITVLAEVPESVFTIGGVTQFNGTNDDVLVFAPDPIFELSEATIAFSFVDENTDPRQGLLSKDATGLTGGGNHFAAYIDDDDLIVRFQNSAGRDTFVFEDLEDGQEYEFATTFGPDGAEVFVDGVSIGSSDFVTSWVSNVEFLQVGGLGWDSDSGEDDFRNPFSGTLAVDLSRFDAAPLIAFIATKEMG